MAADTADTVDLWEARFELDLSVMLHRYLTERPCPGTSPLVGDAERWAENLERHGLERLSRVAGRRLRLTSREGMV
jgi:hypothetical protein